MRTFALFLLCASTLCAQSWSGILSTNRAMRWDQISGLTTTSWPVAGESAPVTPWQPPARSTICSTVHTTDFPGMSSGTPVTPTALNTALSACPTGQAVYLAAGNYYFNASVVLANGVTLRRDVQSTIYWYGTATLQYNGNGNSFNNVTWTAAAAGTSTITVSSVPSGITPGQTILSLYQCQDGFSGAGTCGTGSAVDGGATFVCGAFTSSFHCANSSGNAATNKQIQIVLVTATGSNTLTISPPLMMANWNNSYTPFFSGGNNHYGIGVEGGTDDGTNHTGSGDVAPLSNCYDCWYTGNRAINSSNRFMTVSGNTNHSLVMSNVFASVPPNTHECLGTNTDSFNLFLNNIFIFCSGRYAESGSVGDVDAYEYVRDGWSNSGNEGFMGNVMVNHDPGESLTLQEGNQLASIQDDSAHGSHNLDTFFRNLIQANDPPYTKSSGVVALMLASYARNMNAIGNILGSGTIGSYLNGSNPIYQIGIGTSTDTDIVAQQSVMLWGNCDTFTGTCRFNNSEVPSGLTGAEAPFANSVPANNNLPASFFLPTTAHPAGGTGLSWWKVCTNYPTCSTTQTQPFPTFGPDVTGGGPVIGNATDLYTGHAYDIPAAVAWKYTPVDAIRQGSYSMSSASTYSGGNVTLNFAGGTLPTTLVGQFQISGGPCAGTYVMNGSSATTIRFAAASNPGDCSSGAVLWPNIPQATNGGMFLSDPANPPGFLYTPSSLSFPNIAVNTQSAWQTVTITNAGSGPLNVTSLANTNGKYFGQLLTCGGSPTPVPFSLVSPSPSFTVPAGESCTFQVSYIPQAVGSDAGGVQSLDNSSTSPNVLVLSGNGIIPVAPVPALAKTFQDENEELATLARFNLNW